MQRHKIYSTMNYKKLIFLFTTILLSIVLYSQEPGKILQKSTDKVKIEGKYYYIHIVRKGETLYSISKLYEVSQIDIAMENPDIYLGLQVDQALKIPIKDFNEDNQNELYIYHIVKKGETLFGLSRKYQVEINDIVSVNPDVQSGLMLSQVLRIPKDKLNTLGKKAIPDSIRFYFHQVRPKEGLYSISKLYNINQKVIEKFNADLLINGLKYGSILRIPKNPADTSLLPKYEVVQNISKDKQEAITPVVSSLPNTLCDTFNYQKYKIPFNVSLLLPFETDKVEADTIFNGLLTSYMSVADKIAILDRPEISKSLSIIEFYQGLLMAINQLKKNGLSINLSVFDTQKEVQRVNSILASAPLKNADLIIGPIYPEELKPVAEFARANSKIMISPLSSANHLLYDNPYVYQVFPSFQTQVREFVSQIELCNPGNLMVVYEDDSTNFRMIEQYKEHLNTKISKCSNAEQLHFKEITYKPGGNNIETKDKINQSLTLEKENIIFVPSDNEAFVSDFLSHLFALTTYYGYNVRVYGFPKWQKFKNIPIEYYYKLNLHLFTQVYLDFTKPEIINFTANYRDLYRSEPTQYSFQGYDTGLFFLNALKKYGKDFRKCINNNKTNLLQSDYDFIQVNPSGGFENKSVFLIQYSKDFDIIKIR